MQHPFPHVHGIEHRFVNVNGLNIHVAEAGKGRPVVMLHGWPQHWYLWHYPIPQLANHYRVICPDMRGFGWSDAPATGYDKERLAEDVIGLLDALGLENIRLVGHDWGGWVGFLVCLRQPTRVRRYLALNTPHPFQRFDSRVTGLWKLWYQLVIASPILGKRMLNKPRSFARHVLRWGVTNKTWSEEELAVFTAQLRDPARAYASVLLYRTFILREFLPVISGRYWSSRLSVPTRVLFGVGDFAISTKYLQGYEPYADDMKVEFVSGCGHFIIDEQPELVTERALEFFE